MMKFAYNSDYRIEERIQLVTAEIREEYPNISLSDAELIATLDNPIDDRITNDDKFYRYYMILLVIKRDHPVFFDVLKEAYKLYKDGLKSPILNETMVEIIKYINNDRLDFPIISEFYN